MFQRTLALLALLLAAPAAHACLFGGTLVEMARLRDLLTDPAVTLTAKTQMTELQKRQIVGALQKEGWTEIKTVQDAFAHTDDKQFFSHRVVSQSTGKAYTMYIYSAGDNVHGFIYEENTLERAARIGDASIYDCKPDYESYGSLPWFYSN